MKLKAIAINFLFQILICYSAFAQEELSEFSNQTQTRIEIPIDSNWTRTLIDELEVMSDEQRQWSAESLFATSNNLFKSNTVDTKPVLHNYWARFVLANTTESEQWVSFESYYWDYVRLYFRDSTGIVTRIPFGILSNPNNPKFLVSPQSQYDVLVNFESNGQFRREKNINLIIKPTLPALESKTFTNYMDGIIFGIMFGLALYNLFLFISIRDRTYFWYTLYILSLAFSFMTLFASEPPKWTQFFTSDYPSFAFYIKKIADPIAWISYTNFVRYFLVTKERHPVWDKVLKICIVLIILQFLINLTGIYRFSGVTRSLSWNIPVVICVLLAILSYFKRYTKAKFFIVGQILLVSGIAITTMYYAGFDVIFFLPNTEFFNYFRSPNSIYFFGAAESIIFSFALADKYNMIQNDITRVKIEKEKEKSEAFRLQELDTFKTRFYSNITHEFRTPLTIINGLSNLLLEENNNNGKQKKLLKTINNSNNQLLILVNQMLDLASLDANKMEVSYKNGNVIEFIEKSVFLYKSYSASKQLTLTFKTDVRRLNMDFDDDKLQKIINNLLSNAIKFTPEQGEINVHLKQIKDTLRIIVLDTGKGIEKEQLSQIFDRYYRTYDLNQNIGTGIGLALTKELVELLQGNINVKSEAGKGTSLTIDLPINNTSAKAGFVYETPFIEGDHRESKLEKPKNEKAKYSILVVEDNKQIRDFIKLLLEDLYTIYTAKNGIEGLKIAKNKNIDFIISDVMMPEMNGFEFCEHIKNDIKTSHIPFIIISAKTAKEDKLKGHQLGIDAYLFKPFDKDELLLIIKNLLQKKQDQINYFSQLLQLKEDSKNTKINQLDINLVRNLQEHVLNKNKKLSIDELAVVLGTSRSQLHRKIKALTNTSVTKYINHIRIEKAKNLLVSTKLNSNEIAYEVGFESSTYFSRTFKKELGISPVIYRENHT